MLKIVHIKESTYISHVSRKNSENRTPNLICVQEILQGSQDHCFTNIFRCNPVFICLLQLLKFFCTLIVKSSRKAIQVITYLLWNKEVANTRCSTLPFVTDFQSSDIFLMETLKASTMPPNGGSNTMTTWSCEQPVKNLVKNLTDLSPSKKWWLNMLYLEKSSGPYTCIWKMSILVQLLNVHVHVNIVLKSTLKAVH